VSVKLSEILGAYIAIRDNIAKESREFEESKKDQKDQMGKLETYLKKTMLEMGTDSVKAAGHTAFRTFKDSVKIDDKPEFKLAISTGITGTLVALGLVAESDASGFAEAISSAETFDLLTLQANKTNCKSYMADHKGLMPGGVGYFKEDVVQIRKGN
jgi:hypothetical protein